MAGYAHRTRWGTFKILQSPNGRWQAVFEDEGLGSYHHPVAALDDLLGDHCFSNSRGLDTSRVGLPSDLSEWRRL